jgi:hypothetical protein
MRAGINTKVRLWGIGDRGLGRADNRPEMNGDWSEFGAFIRVARARANRYLIAIGVRCESLIPDVIRGRSAGLKSTLKAWSLIQNGLLRNQ